MKKQKKYTPIYAICLLCMILFCSPAIGRPSFPDRLEIQNKMEENWLSGSELSYRIKTYYDGVEKSHCRSESMKIIDSYLNSNKPFVYVEEYVAGADLVGSILAVREPLAAVQERELGNECHKSLILAVEDENVWNFVVSEAKHICKDFVSFGFGSTRISLCLIVVYDGVSLSYAAFEMPWRVVLQQKFEYSDGKIKYPSDPKDSLIIVQSHRFVSLCVFLDNCLGGNTFVSSRKKSAYLIFESSSEIDRMLQEGNLPEMDQGDWKQELEDASRGANETNSKGAKFKL